LEDFLGPVLTSGICPRADGVVGGATDVGRCTTRRPGIDMPAMPVGPLGDAMIQ